MLLLSATGWTVPAIAAHFRCCQQTVRRLLHRVDPKDLTTLRRRHPGPGVDEARRQRVTAALARLLARDRTRAAAQLAAALAAEQLCLSARRTWRYLQAMRASWRRTARTLRRTQQPERVAQAKEDLAALQGGRKRAS